MKKIGIAWGCYGGLSAEEQIRLMKQNGFETTFSGSNDADLDRIVSMLRQEGIVCESCHAPFDGINNIWYPGEDGERMLDRLIRGAENCARNAIPVMVVHLSSGENAPRVGDVGNDRFDRLMESARKLGVTVAYENQRKLGNLAHAMEQYPDAGFCWDVGHEACFTGGRQYMPLFGKRIVALHLHDNGMEYNADQHLLPYDGKIDMERAARQLAESGYNGSIMLEVIRPNSSLYEGVSAEDYYARAAEAARRFAERVEFFQASLDN